MELNLFKLLHVTLISVSWVSLESLFDHLTKFPFTLYSMLTNLFQLEHFLIVCIILLQEILSNGTRIHSHKNMFFIYSIDVYLRFLQLVLVMWLFKCLYNGSHHSQLWKFPPWTLTISAESLLPLDDLIYHVPAWELFRVISVPQT